MKAVKDKGSYEVLFNNSIIECDFDEGLELRALFLSTFQYEHAPQISTDDKGWFQRTRNRLKQSDVPSDYKRWSDYDAYDVILYSSYGLCIAWILAGISDLLKNIAVLVISGFRIQKIKELVSS